MVFTCSRFVDAGTLDLVVALAVVGFILVFGIVSRWLFPCPVCNSRPRPPVEGFNLCLRSPCLMNGKSASEPFRIGGPDSGRGKESMDGKSASEPFRIGGPDSGRGKESMSALKIYEKTANDSMGGPGAGFRNRNSRTRPPSEGFNLRSPSLTWRTQVRKGFRREKIRPTLHLRRPNQDSFFG